MCRRRDFGEIMARDFDGIDDEMTFSPTGWSGKTAITMMAWLKREGDQSDNNTMAVHIRIGNNNSWAGLRFATATSANVSFQIRLAGVSNAPTAIALTNNLWFMVIGRWLSGEGVKIDVRRADGTSLGSNATAAVSGSFDNMIAGAIGRALNVGAFFNGLIAEVMILDRQLSLDEAIGMLRYRFPSVNMTRYYPLWGLDAHFLAPQVGEVELTGSLDNGNLDGAVFANHAPVGRYVPHRHPFIFPATVPAPGVVTIFQRSGPWRIGKLRGRG